MNKIQLLPEVFWKKIKSIYDIYAQSKFFKSHPGVVKSGKSEEVQVRHGVKIFSLVVVGFIPVGGDIVQSVQQDFLSPLGDPFSP